VTKEWGRTLPHAVMRESVLLRTNMLVLLFDELVPSCAVPGLHVHTLHIVVHLYHSVHALLSLFQFCTIDV